MTAFDLTGKVAVVTGGNGGIGLGMALALAEAGCTISIWGRNAEKNAAAVAQLRSKRGGRAEAAVCDVSDPHAVAAAMAASASAWPRRWPRRAAPSRSGAAMPRRTRAR